MRFIHRTLSGLTNRRMIICTWADGKWTRKPRECWRWTVQWKRWNVGSLLALEKPRGSACTRSVSSRAAGHTRMSRGYIVHREYWLEFDTSKTAQPAPSDVKIFLSFLNLKRILKTQANWPYRPNLKMSPAIFVPRIFSWTLSTEMWRWGDRDG